jgi:hypothetical protein
MRAWCPVVMSVGVGLGGLTAPGRVAAQPPGPPADGALAESAGADAAVRTVEARRRYQEGNAAVKLHQWQRAYDAYLAAWRQRPHWQVAGSLGEVELELGKNKDAATHLALFLREAKDVPPDEMKRVRGWLDQSRARVATVTIATAPPGADLLLDGVAIGRAPLREELYLEPGQHQIDGHLGQCAATERLELVAGQSREIKLSCEVAAPALKGAVAAPAAPVAAPIASKRSFPARRAVLIAGAGVTVASLGLGVTSIALFAAKGHTAKVNHEPASGPDAKAEATFKSVALWSFLTAGLVGGATLVYAIKTERSGRPRVNGSIVVGPMGGAAVLQGDF